MASSVLPLLALWGMVTGPAPPVPRGEWRPTELRVAERAPATTFEELRAIGLRYVGRPYVRAGVGSPGFDCSGLTCRVFAEAGYPLPRTSREQFGVGQEVPLDALEPGDLLFFARPRTKRIEHVGIYLGGGEMLHAATGRGRVMISDLSERWYKQRIVGARRILPETASSTAAIAVRRALLGRGVRELDEHADDDLPPMLRLPRDLAEPRLGAELGAWDATALGVRLALVTEGRVPGVVVAPELTIVAESIGLQLALAVPIRADLEGDATPSIGPIERPADVLRFVRGAALGLRGADLELRLDRFGDFDLGPGLSVDRLQPSAAVQGVVGLTRARTPLTAFGAYRAGGFELQALMDDVVDPGVLGGSLRVPLVAGWLSSGAAFTGDLRASPRPGVTRPFWSGEVEVALSAVATPAWTVNVAAQGGLMRHEDESGDGESGAAASARVDAEYRWARGGTGAVSVRLQGAHAWSGYVPGIFGATYAAARPETYALLETTGDRFTLGGELSLRVGPLVVSGGHQDAVGADAQVLERRSFGLVELRDLALFGTTLADVRVAYAARGLLHDAAVDVLHGGLRLRFRSWLYAEAYLAKTTGFEGGFGLVGAFIP